MNDDLHPVPKWRIGELSIGLHSHEDLLALAQSFCQTELFLDAVEDLLKRVDVVFGLRRVGADGRLSFLDPPPHRDEVVLIRHKFVAVYLAWQVASDLNPAVAAFKGNMLEELRNEIHRVNRDAIDAACNGTELEKFNAAHNSSKDIKSAFYKVNRELGIHRAKYDLAERVSGEKGDKQITAEVAQDPPPPFLAHVVHHDSTVLGPMGEDNPLKGLNAEVKPTSASPSIDEEPHLGLVFHHDSTALGPSGQDNPPIRWSNYRQPQEWRRLRKLKGLSYSVNIWTDLLRSHPNDIQCESTKSARISFELAQSWGLDLLEFRT